MKTQIIVYLLTIALGVLFFYLFHNEWPGINVPLFFFVSSTILAILNPGAFRHGSVQVSLVAAFTASVCVIVFNSDISIISFWLLFAVMVGFVHHFQLRSAGTALLSSVLAMVASPFNWWIALEMAGQSNLGIKRLLKFLRLSLLPVIVLFFFFLLYSAADEQFSGIVNQLFGTVIDLLHCILEYISPSTILFFILAMVVSTAILMNRKMSFVLKYELAQNDFLQRNQNKRKSTPGSMEAWKLFFRYSVLNLKHEYSRGVLLLMMVNVLLLFVNVVDIKLVWFENQVNVSPHGRSQAVHESTYLLLFSIVAAIGLLLFFFRGNLNFYKSNRPLRLLSYAWIIQNALLAFTAGIRNYYYIRDFGLAYKRIGVIYFLALTLFGLWILWIKISEKRTFFYCYRMTGWAVCALLIGMSCANWESMIASYNITHFQKAEMDTGFLMSKSHRALPAIIEHLDPFENKDDVASPEDERFQTWIKVKSLDFMHAYEATSWPSWSLEDWRVYEYLEKHKNTLQK